MHVAPALRKNASDGTVGEIVAEDFRTATVFAAHGIDFCCGGSVPLAEICRQRGVDPAALLREIETVKSGEPDRSQNYAAWELPFLADYIVNTHHVYLRENDDQIAAYARKIADVHGAHHPEVIDIAAIFDRINSDMVAHLREEEEVFFPAVKRLAAAGKAGTTPAAEDRRVIEESLAKLGHEHQEIGDAVHAIRHLSREYAIPDDVCNTFMVAYRKLEEFENDLHKHVHLENNILFPKAARL